MRASRKYWAVCSGFAVLFLSDFSLASSGNGAVDPSLQSIITFIDHESRRLREFGQNCSENEATCPKILYDGHIFDRNSGLYEWSKRQSWWPGKKSEWKKGTTIDSFCREKEPSALVLKSPEDLEEYLRHHVLLPGASPAPRISRECFRRYHVGALNSDFVAETYYVTARLRQGGLLALQETAALNLVLGEDDPQKDLRCVGSEIPDYRRWCEHIKKCDDQGPASQPFCLKKPRFSVGKEECVNPGPGFDSIVARTREGLELLKEPRKELIEVERKMMDLALAEACPSYDPSTAPPESCRTEEEQKQFAAKRNELEERRTSLLNVIHAVEFTNPWIISKKFEEVYRNGKGDLREAIYLQLRENRRSNLALIAEYEKAARCLKGDNVYCVGFLKTILKAPSHVELVGLTDLGDSQEQASKDAKAALAIAECRWETRQDKAATNAFAGNLLTGLTLATAGLVAGPLGFGPAMATAADLIGAGIAVGQVSSDCKEALHIREQLSTSSDLANGPGCVATGQVAGSRLKSDVGSCLVSAASAALSALPVAVSVGKAVGRSAVKAEARAAQRAAVGKNLAGDENQVTQAGSQAAAGADREITEGYRDVSDAEVLSDQQKIVTGPPVNTEARALFDKLHQDLDKLARELGEDPKIVAEAFPKIEKHLLSKLGPHPSLAALQQAYDDLMKELRELLKGCRI